MSEKRWKIGIEEVSYECDTCKAGEMIHTKFDGTYHVHICNKCEAIAYFKTTYPHRKDIRIRLKDSGER